jgi:hypothetical protein
MPFKPIPLANLGACDMLLQPSTYNIRGSLIGSTELLHALIFDQEFRNLLQPKSRCVTTQARQEIRIWRGLTQRHMGVRGRTVT